MFFCYLHLKPVHIKEKPFKCNQWNYKSVLLSSLQLHQRVHSGKKSYQCNQCNSLFAHDDTLKKHLRMHIGLKPYKCNQCNKRSLVKKAHDPSHQCRTKEAQMYPVWILYKPSSLMKCVVQCSPEAQKPKTFRIAAFHTQKNPTKCANTLLASL